MKAVLFTKAAIGRKAGTLEFQDEETRKAWNAAGFTRDASDEEIEAAGIEDPTALKGRTSMAQAPPKEPKGKPEAKSVDAPPVDRSMSGRGGKKGK